MPLPEFCGKQPRSRIFAGGEPPLTIEYKVEGKPTNFQLVHKDVARLNLSRQSITSIILPEGLGWLGELDLSENQLTSLTLPQDLTSLDILDLSGNQLTSLTLPNSLPRLQLLDLSENPLTSLTLPQGLTGLMELNLAGNQLTTLTLPQGLTSLRKLYIRWNQLTTLTLPEGLTSLEWLDLTENQLTNVTLPQGLTSLGYLSLAGNQLTTLTLPEGLDLVWLDLQENPLKLLRVPAEMNIENWWDIPADTRIEFYEPSPPSPLDEPSLPRGFTYRRLANGLELSWEGGTLQKSAGVEGPWEDVHASSPLQVSPALSSEFFRLRVEGSSTSPPDPDLPTDPNPLPEPGSHPLPLNGSLEGSIDAEGEVDVYQITVTGSGALTVYSTGSMDLYGRLLDDSGNELASNDDGGEDTNFRISRSVDAGTYYVRVRHYDNSGTGNYGITSEFR